MQFDLSLFEPLKGVTPFRLLAVHPTEPLVALQISFDVPAIIENPHLSVSHVAIWNRETYELVSVPEHAMALAWNADGDEMGFVRRYHLDPNYNVEGSSLFSYIWERLSWPEQKLISSCDLTFNASWPEVVVFSPAGDLALIQWFEAEKSGLEFVDLAGYGDSQLESIGLPSIAREVDDLEAEEDERFFVETNLATAPVFSPDGRYIIFGWQRHQRWWTDVPDDVYVEGELPARVGECQVGYVQIIDGKKLTNRLLSIFVTLPPGWQPSYEGDHSNELLSDPIFINNEHFQLELPTGEVHVYSVFSS
jgi:hypothetical protein